MKVWIDLADLVAIAFFIYGLHELNSPATARRGNRFAMAGMAIAFIANRRAHRRRRLVRRSRSASRSAASSVFTQPSKLR